ncbi:hyaluronoglucosaminidase [Necator americanus]|uniref:Hyaluronidase n=1 Tax=Necator americanus TaxID=51031 RepID=W2SX16_NECAM|nr:hyaluronoglucosaminidase [Necator americanus]ETN74274.1 hyaluronoglucosaminidase [Necator americanus]
MKGLVSLPGDQRVNQVLANQPEFAAAFQCDMGTPMNPMERFGKYPYYKDYNKSIPINGGLPQNCNLRAHLEMVKTNITEKIKDQNSTGLGIIDFEEWRPLFSENGYDLKRDCDLSAFLKEFEQRINVAIESNFNGLGVIDLEHWRPLFEENGNDKMRIYQNVSIEKAKKQYPNLTEPEVRKKATEEMMAIFNKSDALYPSIYLGEKDKTTPDRSDRYIYAILKEARRIAHKFSPPLPIYAYTKFEYDPQTKLNDFYLEADLCRTIKKPGDMGIDGIIHWSSSRNITRRCVYIKDEVTNPVGPHTNDTVMGHKSCREKLCKGHGKCVSKTNTTCTDKNDYSVKEGEYMCECDFGYVGDSCDHTTTTTTATTPKPKR